MTDWSMHRHIATVGIGNPLFDRAWCAACRQPWPCRVAQKKRAYEATAELELAKISGTAERVAFVEKMRTELHRIDGVSR